MIVFVEELMVRNTPQMFLGASSATSVPAEALHCKAAVEL